MAGIKVRRTLDDRGFKKYMKFCESLKDGSNDALIDTFKYRFAVMEGRIVPKGAKRKKPLTEAAGLQMGDFEKAFQGLVGAFLPHLDEEEQNFLGCVCQVLDEKVNGGDMDGAMDALKNAVRDAGGDPECDDDDDECPECEDGECPECDDGECPEGTCKVDGECVPCKDDKKPNSDDAEEECCCGKTKKMTEAVYPDNPRSEGGYPKELDFGRSTTFADPLDEDEGGYDDSDLYPNQGFHDDPAQDIDRVWAGRYAVEDIHDFKTASSFGPYFGGNIGICEHEQLWDKVHGRQNVYICYREDFDEIKPGDPGYDMSMMCIGVNPDGSFHIRNRSGQRVDEDSANARLGHRMKSICKPPRNVLPDEPAGDFTMRAPLSGRYESADARTGRPMTECGEQESLVEDLDWLKKHNAKENKAHSARPNFNTFAEDRPVYGDFYDDPDNRYQDRDILPDDDGFEELDFDHEAAVPPAAYDDEAREPIADYDAMADDLLRDAGYGDLASDSMGVGEENRRFYGR